MGVSRRALASVAASLLALGSIAVVPAPMLAAGTWQYPSASCPTNGNHGLQDCIDAAAPGDTIVMTSQINPDGVISIGKSLTLRASSRSLGPTLPYISIFSSGGAVDVTVQDIRVERKVRVNFNATASGHLVTLRRLEVGKGTSNADGVSFDTQAPASFVLEQSYVRAAGSNQGEALHLFAEDPDGRVDIRVVGNRLSDHGNPQSGSGIALTAIGDGTVRADLDNNSIWDVGRCLCGGASGIFINPSDRIRADVNVVGNTIERSRTDGIQQRNGLTGIGHLALDVFNNIISHTDGSAIRLDSGSPGTLTFRAGHNDRFKNTFGSLLDGQSAGSGNKSVDPRFVDRTNGSLRLRSDSALIDAGVTCSPGGVANPDPDGHHRLRGSTVDIGAYERGARSASGVVRVGTSGKDTLVGTSGRDILCGYGGNDTLCAKDGKGGDLVDGGSGRDKARTDSGDIRRSIEATASCFT